MNRDNAYFLLNKIKKYSSEIEMDVNFILLNKIDK